MAFLGLLCTCLHPGRWYLAPVGKTARSHTPGAINASVWLITSACGFTGKHIRFTLANSQQVKTPDSQPPRKAISKKIRSSSIRKTSKKWKRNTSSSARSKKTSIATLLDYSQQTTRPLSVHTAVSQSFVQIVNSSLTFCDMTATTHQLLYTHIRVRVPLRIPRSRTRVRCVTQR